MINEKLLQKLDKDLKQSNVELVIVTKTQSIEDIEKLYSLGYRNFGENKVQELLSKEKILPKDIKWHMIGHLQTNKVKYITPFIHMIQSVDSEKLLKEIEKKANTTKIKCLLQVKISTDETKYGFSPEEINDFFAKSHYKNYQNIEFVGLMGMSTLTNDTNQVEKEFDLLKKTFLNIKKQTKLEKFNTLSMGMSSDYILAIKNGSNMVRIGSIIFTN